MNPGLPTLRYWRRNFEVFLATWKTTILPPLLEPLLYLVAFGAGVGVLIGGLTYRGETIQYIRFVAPGIISVGVMFWAFFEGTYSVFIRFRYQRTQEAVMTTPLTVEEIIVGEILWCASKGLVAGYVTCTVVAVARLMAWPDALWLLLILPLGSLVFAALGVFCCSLVNHINTINVPIFLLIWPMYLFSGTFFPLEVMPAWARAVAWLLPLTHFVHLVRSATLGLVEPRLWISVAVLVAYAAALIPPGTVIMRRKLIR